MKFTLKEFFTQVGYFRQLMGDKTFWSKPETIRREAVNGLTFVYTNTESNTQDEEGTLQTIFTATIEEYVRRELMMGPLGRVCC